MHCASSLKIGSKVVSINEPTYFIADIAANHDGDLGRAKDLIWSAKEAGADCAKFQHFLADKIVSSVGFAEMKGPASHQAKWEKPVVEVYDQYHTRRDWTEALVETCRAANIDFMTTPYDLEAIETFKSIVPAFKVGSGDITFSEALDHIAVAGKPVFLATGASTMDETIEAAERILLRNPYLCLMQCNTNYTGDIKNFASVNLNVLRAFALKWPNMVLGFSDHTPGHSAVLGAVALGARVVEKHFTDDNSRVGPDHAFALNPFTWRAMVDATRELEVALGDGIKRVEANEHETVVIQRRAMRMTQDIPAGTVLTKAHFEALRPCPPGSVTPNRVHSVLGRVLAQKKRRGEALMWDDLT